MEIEVTELKAGELDAGGAHGEGRRREEAASAAPRLRLFRAGRGEGEEGTSLRRPRPPQMDPPSGAREREREWGGR